MAAAFPGLPVHVPAAPSDCGLAVGQSWIVAPPRPTPPAATAAAATVVSAAAGAVAPPRDAYSPLQFAGPGLFDLADLNATAAAWGARRVGPDEVGARPPARSPAWPSTHKRINTHTAAQAQACCAATPLIPPRPCSAALWQGAGPENQTLPQASFPLRTGFALAWHPRLSRRSFFFFSEGGALLVDDQTPYPLLLIFWSAGKRWRSCWPMTRSSAWHGGGPSTGLAPSATAASSPSPRPA